MWLPGRGQGHNLNKLGKGSLDDDTVHTKYQGYRPTRFFKAFFALVAMATKILFEI